MTRKYLLLDITFVCWLVALIAWCTGDLSLAKRAGMLAPVTLIIFALQGWIPTMFKKHKTTETADVAVYTGTPATLKNGNSTDGQTTTVIASDARVEGNIIASSPVCIHGSLKGNIDAPGSRVTVMCEGQVEGDIVCRELIIDGSVIGRCRSDMVQIDENGKMTGTLSYRTLAIKNGGQLSGQAEVFASREENDNVVGFVADTSAVLTEEVG